MGISFAEHPVLDRVVFFPAEHVAPPFFSLTDPLAHVSADELPLTQRTFVLVEFVDGGGGRPLLSGRGRDVTPAHHADLVGYMTGAVDPAAPPQPNLPAFCARVLAEFDGCKFVPTAALERIGTPRECPGCRCAAAAALDRARNTERTLARLDAEGPDSED